MKDTPPEAYPEADPRKNSSERPEDPIPVVPVGSPGPKRSSTAQNGSGSGTNRASSPGVDLWLALDIVVQRWLWLLLSALIFAGLLFAVGQRIVKPKYTASAQLLRFETPGEKDFFDAPLSSETFSALLRSPELLRKVGDEATPRIPPEQFIKIIKVDPEPDSDVIKLLLAARQPQTAVWLLNSYATNAVAYARQQYAERAKTTAQTYLGKQVKEMEDDIRALDDQFRNLHLPPELNTKLTQVGGALSAMTNNVATPNRSSALIAKQRERLDTAMAELNELLAKYMPIHPAVIAKQGQIKDLEDSIKKQTASAATNVVFAPEPTASRTLAQAARPGDPASNPEIDIVRMKITALEQGRVALTERHRQAELYASNPPGVVRILAPATIETVQNNKRSLKIAAVTVFGAGLGFFFGLVLVLLVEFMDNRLKTVDDVKRVTHLPVLTTLGDIKEMTPENRALWAFRAWTMLQGRLSPTANHGLVCGVTSSEPGEGRSTWIHLLAEAASLTGFRVLTIATRPSATHVQLGEGNREPRETGGSAPKPNGKGDPVKTNGHETTAGPAPAEPRNGNSSALTTSVLTSPGEVTQKFTGPDSQPMVHIPLPGWVWNLERRKQWGEALSQWRQIDNLVILVELPPASVPEAVLLGSNLPNLLWLTNSGSAQAGATRTQLETLRHARCNMVGAVLNRETAVPVKKRFPRWLGCVVVCFCLSLPSARAESVENQSPAALPAQVTSGTNRSERVGGLSITRPDQRAAWQQRLTLGPGDVLSFSLYGAPELSRTEVAIGPDGRVSYLEAQDIVAAGLTIDELRAKLDDAIGKYRRAPRTMVAPVAFRSKKYYMLGKVMTKGVYTLDRPLTVIEAIARAHGFENGLIDRNVIDLADFQRSFLMRNGKRIPLNFERLFQEGDLSQNLAVEPGDYLYFASAEVKEVYVVGEVRLPGPVTYTTDMSIIGAITGRGGFTERAFKSRVLVIRGSLDHPEPIIVDTADIIKAKARNFKVEPRDIIYVNSRPFIRVEELADLAATAFIQSVITSWVGVNVVKPIQ